MEKNQFNSCKLNTEASLPPQSVFTEVRNLIFLTQVLPNFSQADLYTERHFKDY